jgi:Ca-activated chloride channel family protein
MGPTGRPRRWVRGLPFVKAIALGGMAWALATICYGSGSVFNRREGTDDRRELRQHVAFVADLSPSMSIEDAGPDGDRTRSARIHEVVDGILQRLDGDVLFSVIGFYTNAMPVVVDAEDAELVRNVFNGLPVHYVMKAGKTDLGMGVSETLGHLREYPEESTTVFICTDGDTIPMEGIPKRPAAVKNLYVLGVGDPNQGTFIDDHLSRQDAALLRTLAGRLHGQYIDVNEKHISTLALGALAMGVGVKGRAYDLFDIAIVVFAAGAILLALIPVMLELFGSDWKTIRPSRTVMERGIR